MFRFTISLGSFRIYDDSLFFVNNTIVYFHTLQSVHLLLSHLPSLLPFLKTIPKKKQQEKGLKKVFQRKTSACRDETLKNQPNKMQTTPQHIHTIPTSCGILPTMHNKKLLTHSLNEHGTQHCSLHSLPHKRQSTSDSATIKFRSTT